MSQEPTQTQSSAGDPTAWFTPEWLYDEIMRCIEPDLVSSSLPMLDAKYAGEDPAEREFRLGKYQEAFALFDIALEKFEEAIGTQLRGYKQVAQKKALKEEQDETSQALHAIEQELDQSQA